MPEFKSSQPPSVLVVDDEADVLKQIRRVLRRQGFEVATAQSGEAALQALDEEKPDLIVMDISMPDMGGLEILAAVRQRHRDFPVILMTAKNQLARAHQALARGAFDYVQRPLVPKDLVACCRRAVEMVQLKRENRVLRKGISREMPASVSRAARPERAAMERAALSRVTSLLGQAISKASTGTLERALGEAAPSMVLTDVLAEALLEDATEGEWAAALLRGAQVKRELLREAGGTLSGSEVGTLLGISRAAVDKRRRQGALLGLKLPSGDIAYPAAQFDRKDVLAGLPKVLDAFQIQDPWMQLDVLLARDESLGGRTSFKALADGEVELVKSVVSTSGDQGL